MSWLGIFSMSDVNQKQSRGSDCLGVWCWGYECVGYLESFALIFKWWLSPPWALVCFLMGIFI